MPNNFPLSWKRMLLEDCMSVIIDYRGKTPRKVPFGVPLITAKIIKNGRIGSIEEYIATEDYVSWMNRGLPQAGDVVMTTEGPLGEIAQLDDRKVVPGQRVITLRGIPTLLNNTFLKFQMISSYVQQQLRARATGTTVQGIRQSELRKLNLIIPPLPEQQAIAHILGSLDDKIELNRQMNETLEGIARALFQSWFVDFDPVRAKMAGRQPYGMDAETAALSPDGFEDSVLGEIPRGWRVAKLGNVVEFAYGKALKEENRRVGSIPVYGSNGQVGWHDEALVMGPGIVIGRKGNPGTVTLSEEAFFPIDTTFYIVPKGSFNQIYYLFYAIKDLKLQAYSADSAVPGLNRNIAYMTDLVIPELGIANLFGNFATPIYQKIKANKGENYTLAALRDALLPKLLSGELQVGEAEKEVGAIL
jgi:type I restriction enzyme S subunit